MSSQVLALKYRPSSFDKLIGQESITQTLSLALNQDRLSHAYLFSGLRGSGKTSTARIFAKALVCDQGLTSTPCEVCEHCLSANENRHIDIIEMDAASNRGIDDIRELIESTKYKPTSARFKIFIIDEVHMLTTQAFNALLKTLEEPPSYVKFILATTDPLKLPATILSRAQHFRFKQIKQSDVVNHLCHILNLENIEYEKEALEMLSRAGNGSLRDTLTLLDQAIIYSKGYITPENVATMLGLLDPNQLESIFTTLLSGNKNEMLHLIKELESYECEIVIDELIAYLKNAFFAQDRRFSTLLYERFFKILSEAKSLLYINANNGFVLSLIFFKMIEATNIKTVEEMIDSLENEKYRLPATQAKQQIEQSTETPTAKAEEPLHVNDQGVTPATLFARLCDKLLDRNAELGECFKTHIRFDQFSDATLTLNSSAHEESGKILKNNSAIIRHFVQDIFGFETKIQINKIQVPHAEPTPTFDPNIALQMSEAEFNANDQSASMMESLVFEEAQAPQGDSCAAGALMADKKEIDAKEVLNTPFVQKATELFDPQKIQIRQKV
ncbi:MULTISPECIES: DNA polymerase III subunit gamma/tau [unclassified Sulfurospirillum]|uniref:DNA polymerase III subunit gamma/tau n=1 Tax=unclassified Sulfurospirillum TaxID=2618290 RepID=UPI0005023307|nr:MULTISPECIES: DNA polymerase III subunit gamma/tau [unclassified Sulfurospirillum]KFL34831.1 DNA polymerase III subunit gamma/tau [Sulfurospirillum sp. SCADC]